MRLRLSAVTPISESEIAQELYYRNYSTGQVTTPPPVTISRADAIKAGVNKALDSRGMARKASSMTYIDVIVYSNIIAEAKSWANAYLDGSQTPSSSLLSGIGGLGMRKVLRGVWDMKGLRGLNQVYDPNAPGYDPSQIVQPPAQQGVSGWWILASLVGTAIQSYAQYQMTKNYMQSAGYAFPSQGYYTYQQQLAPYEPPPKETTPVWVWGALGVAALYVLTQRKT